MNAEQLTSIGFITLKVLTIFGLLLYTVFAGIVVRQEQLMSKVLAQSSEAFLHVIAFVHLIASIALVLLAIIIL